MTIDTSTIDDDLPALVALRHDLHRHPELGLEEVRTSEIVARELADAGWRVTRGLGKTGLVATLANGHGRRSLGLRADMDALPIIEETGLSYRSRTPGLMHACGHDGHTTMLLGAARALARRRAFDGTIHLIFQPAEENFGGARLMIEDGLFRRFPCDGVFALHNTPDLPLGMFGIRPGPIMAAVDEATITIEGRGGHSATPQDTADPIVTASSLVMALQTIIARNVDPRTPAVVSVCALHAGSASNIIPSRASMVLTIRSLDPTVRDTLETRITALAKAQAESFGTTAMIAYERSYPATINHVSETTQLREAAVAFAGDDHISDLAEPCMGSEDFAYMLEEEPGSYFFFGAGDSRHTARLHQPTYDFNDAALPIGAAFWVNFAERFLDN
ncbi:MAG: M20 aminoacylase family protein [Geminicoccaceae bacterium]